MRNMKVRFTYIVLFVILIPLLIKTVMLPPSDFILVLPHWWALVGGSSIFVTGSKIGSAIEKEVDKNKR